MKTILGIACMLLAVTQACCQFQSGDNVQIQNKAVGDQYLTGSDITINAPVYGDLIVAGGTITLNDTVTQDLVAAGGTLSINGLVRDDVRCAGGTIRISKNVDGDLVATGSNITIDKGVSILGNLYIAGGEVTVNGDVAGSIKSASGVITLNGKTGKDLDCRGGKLALNGIVHGTSVLSANEILLGADAKFNKDVRYWNKAESLDFGNTINGKATLDPSLEIEKGKWHYLGFGSALVLLWYLGTALLMIVLVQYLFSPVLSKSADTVKLASLKSLGLGLLFLIGVPVAVVLCIITIVGLPVGVLLAILYVTILLLATVIVALVAAHWVNNTNYNGTWSSRKIIFIAFGIFIVLKLASLTPFVGPLVMFLLACMAFGAILLQVKWRHNQPLSVS
jgi:cytoskeletal protein CcmA (bactofilin family)